MLRPLAVKQNHHAKQCIISFSKRMRLSHGHCSRALSAKKCGVSAQPWRGEVDKGAYPRLGPTSVAVDQLRGQVLTGKVTQPRYSIQLVEVFQRVML